MLPGQEAPEPSPIVHIEDEDSPTRVVDTGSAKLVFSKKDGSLRPLETGFANMDKIFGWAAQQIERVQQTRDAQQQRPAPRRQLPPDVIEVTPGYQPPAGYVPVPLNEHGEPQFAQALPPPPSNIPPPLGYPPPVGAPRQAAPRQAPRPAPAPSPPQPAPQPTSKRWGPPPQAPR